MRYKKFHGYVIAAAMKTIGKTTYKEVRTEKFSTRVTEMRTKKKELWKQIQKTKCNETVQNYLDLQTKITDQILEERTAKIDRRLDNMMKDKSKNTFWKERKKANRDELSEWMVTKNDKMERIYDTEKNMENVTSHFESLFRQPAGSEHPYHEETKNMLLAFKGDTNYDSEWYNKCPTESEIIHIIENKKNNKASTGIKNEMIKNVKIPFVKILMPVIQTVWEEETIPTKWNEGRITSLYKGKGDREVLSNHRGITYGDSIGDILEEAIHNRITPIIPFTQSQAGGIKGASTCDHVFIIRSIILLAITSKRNVFLTFYDIAKVYDHADVPIMLRVLWERGFKGKA